MDFPKTKPSRIDSMDLNDVINRIILRFQAKREDALYIESTITAAICDREECAFKDGFYLCLELLNDNILK